MKQIKIIVEKHDDGYIAYPLGLKGVVVAEGDTYEQALAEVKTAIQFHLETFGQDVANHAESSRPQKLHASHYLYASQHSPPRFFAGV